MSSNVEARASVTTRLGASARRALSSWVVVVAGVWFVVSVIAVVWPSGLHPHIFLTPDEMANRRAASVISRTGHPLLKLPFADPEDVLHPRFWLSQGDVAIPIYPPVTVYFYALLACFGRFGWIILTLLPASAVAAFAAGVARLLPPARRWLALFAPALGMPVLYWIWRPWMNICALLTCLCWASYFFCAWRAERRNRWLDAAMLCVALGVAARPDYTAYVLLVALLLAWGAEPSAWRRVLVATFCAGALALAANMIGNYLVTGRPLRAAYQLAMASDKSTPHLNPVLGLLRLLFFPMLFPGWGNAAHELLKYWVFAQPTWLLVALELTLLLWLKRRGPAERVAVGAVVLIALCFCLSRIESGTFGSGRHVGFVSDSLPRYLSPVFLLASLPPVLALGEMKPRWLFALGALAVGVLAAGNLAQIVWVSPQSIVRHREQTETEQSWLDRLEGGLVPRNAVVYTPNLDKVLGSAYLVASYDDDEPRSAAKSMQRATEHALPVYLWLRREEPRNLRALEHALAKRNLALVRIDRTLCLYRVDPTDAGAPGP